MRRVTSLLTVLAFIWAGLAPLGAVQASPVGQAVVKVDKLPSGSTVTVAINIGKVPSATASVPADSNGEATLALSLGNLGKNDDTPVDVYIGQCPNNEVRMWIVAQGQEPPDQCGRKKIAGFLLNLHPHITIHYPGELAMSSGIFTTRNEIIGGAVLAGIVIWIVASGGNSTSSTSSSGTTSSSSGTTSSSSGGTTPNLFQTFNGKTLSGTLNFTANGCGTSLGSLINAQATVNLNTSGAGTFVVIQTNNNATLTHPTVQATALTGNTGFQFADTITSTINGRQFQVTDTVTTTLTSLSLVEAFVGLGSAACTAVAGGTLVAAGQPQQTRH